MARDLKRIRQTQLLRWGVVLAFFLIVNFVLKFSIIWINEAEYTDGILQVTQFVEPTAIWPPLYTAVVWPLSELIGQLWAGRIVSTIFSILGVIPIYLLARRSFGSRPAMFAALIYTVAPTALRWAPRVMTEATFCFFFWFAIERLVKAQGSRSREEANAALLWATVLGVFASLTRYQGMMLIIPALYIPVSLWIYRKFFPLKGFLSVALYGLVPLWSHFSGNIHGDQFMDRAGHDPFNVFIHNAEPFLLYMPYFLTYPVAILIWIGMIKGKSRPRYMLMPITIFVFSVLMISQSLFSSFQERYFLPFFGLLYVWGGLGMAIQDHVLRRKASRLRVWVPLFVIIWSFYIALFVLVGSRGAFGDIRSGARHAAKLVEGQPNARIYTDELYRAGKTPQERIAANKVKFFARREVHYLEFPPPSGRTPLRVGDVLVLSDVYGREQYVRALAPHYDLELAGEYVSRVLPIFPDIMQDSGVIIDRRRPTSEELEQNPELEFVEQQIRFGLGQNPLAWHYRYNWQFFSTGVYRVTRVRNP